MQVKDTGITGSPELRWDYAYNDRNDVTKITRYKEKAATNLVGTTDYVQDDGGRVTSITHKDSSGTKIDDFVYAYDAANRVKSETSHLGPDPTYDYDLTDQLTGDGTNTYDWDANGNPDGSDYTIGTGNRLDEDATWNYTYSDEGNLTKKVHKSTDEEWHYSFDHLNRLVKAEHKPDATSAIDKQADYKYDVFNNRIERSWDADGAGSGSATVEEYAYEALFAEIGAAGSLDSSQWHVWADLNSSGSLTTRRVNQNSVDAVMARVDSSGNVAWYLTDKLGSVREVVNATGSKIYEAHYDGFGSITSESGSGGDRYKWTGREWDAEIEAQYNRARWYDPATKRWLSEDPVGFDAGDSNLFRYVKNKPVILNDPSGLQPINSKAGWIKKTIQNAGLAGELGDNGVKWLKDIQAGTNTPAKNRAILVKIYSHYEKVYRKDKNRFLWMGLAVIAGNQVVKGVDALKDDRIPKSLEIDVTRLLTMMAINIFTDLTWQHTAYVEGGGLKAIKALHESKAIDKQMFAAWQNVDSGVPAKVKKGNEHFVYVEQVKVLRFGYQQLDKHKLVMLNQQRVKLTQILSSQAMTGLGTRRFITYAGFTGNIADPTPNATNVRWRWIRDEAVRPWAGFSQAKRDQFVAEALKQLQAPK